MKLLSESELRKELIRIGVLCYKNPCQICDKYYIPGLTKLFQQQQQAWGEYVIGEKEKVQPYSSDPEKSINAQVRNWLRDEQRQRNAGKELVEGDK